MSVLLLSGGLDSAVCLVMEKPDVALFVDYGQPNLAYEKPRAQHLALDYGVPITTAKVILGHWRFGGDAMIVPGRNRVFIALAATLGASVIIGCNEDDRETYEDCRGAFFDAIDVEVETPLLTMTKEEIGAEAYRLGIRDHQTWSCYYPTGTDPCGKCGACKGRARALEEPS